MSNSSLLSDPIVSFKKFLRECPTSIGQPRVLNSCSLLIISKFCCVVFPNPIPGSMIIFAGSIPFSINKSIKRLKPKPPFTTSTLQQEASSKLKFSTSTTMSCAQKLFEGIDLNGQHLALISYHRTDSIELSQEFIPAVKDYIISKYGEEYYNSIASLQTNKNKENVESGHEAIRPVDLSITPDKLKTLLKE